MEEERLTDHIVNWAKEHGLDIATVEGSNAPRLGGTLSIDELDQLMTKPYGKTRRKMKSFYSAGYNKYTKRVHFSIGGRADFKTLCLRFETFAAFGGPPVDLYVSVSILFFTVTACLEVYKKDL